MGVMTPSNSRRWNDVRMGVLLLLILAPLAIGVFFLDTLRRAFLEGPELVLLTSDTHGLNRGAAVWVAGVPAGRVVEIGFVDADSTGRRTDIAVRMVLLRSVASSLREDAVGQIGRAALLAPPVVKLTPGSPAAPEYDFRRPLRESPAVDLDTFRGLADSSRVAVRNLANAADSLRRLRATGRGSLQRFRNDPEVLRTLRRGRSEARTILASWSAAEGLRSFRRDRGVRAATEAIAARLPTLRTEARRAARSSHETTAAIGRLGERLDRLSERLDTADGTLGRLGRDAELAIQIDRARSQLDSLLTDARSRPLRYLRFRLF